MTFQHRTRRVNPRLGVYFGIFASVLVALFLLVLISEQLGASAEHLKIAMLVLPALGYLLIGLATRTQVPLDFFAAGRRVPAIFAGLGMAVTATGATGLVVLAGAFFLVGFDAVCLAIGAQVGFVLMAVLLAPFLRKFGSYTIASYLGRRFESRALRIAAAGLLAVPMLLVLAAELRMGGFAAAWLGGLPEPLAVSMIALAALGVISMGGMRSLAWSNSAQAFVAIVALMAPVAIAAVLITNLPVPQLTHGPLLRALLRSEAAQGLPILVPPPFSFEMPDPSIAAITKRYAEPFGMVSPAGYVIATLTTMVGVAAAPWLLLRVATTPSVYDARKSLGWATVFFGLAMLTLSSVAVFMRDAVMDIVLEGSSAMPDWLTHLTGLGLAHVDQTAGRPTLGGIAVRRDAVLFALPLMAKLPYAFLYLALAGAVAAALAAASAAIVGLGHSLAEDVVSGMVWEPPMTPLRVWTARAAMVGATLAGLMIALVAPADPLDLLLWALALTGSSAFPVLVLSIWWKRINAFGALAGLCAGFGIACLAILAGEANILFGIDGALSALFGVPAAVAAAMITSTLTPAPTRHALELVRDIRVPGGEILYDREVRLQRSKERRS